MCDRHDAAAAFVFLAAVVVEPNHPVGARNHEERVVEQTGRYEQVRFEAGFDLNRWRSEQPREHPAQLRLSHGNCGCRQDRKDWRNSHKFSKYLTSEVHFSKLSSVTQ